MSDMTPREYVQTMRRIVKNTIEKGDQVDFYDALAASRMSGEMAVSWFHPALKEAQEECGVFKVRCAELTALLDEYFVLVDDKELNMNSERFHELLFDLENRMRATLKAHA